MTTDGSQTAKGLVFMLPELTREEMLEMRLAMKARQRANGSGTRPHRLCVSILRKMDDAESSAVRGSNGHRAKPEEESGDFGESQ